MKLEIELPDMLYNEIREIASATGKSPDLIIQEAIEKHTIRQVIKCPFCYFGEVRFKAGSTRARCSLCGKEFVRMRKSVFAKISKSNRRKLFAVRDRVNPKYLIVSK